MATTSNFFTQEVAQVNAAVFTNATPNDVLFYSQSNASIFLGSSNSPTSSVQISAKGAISASNYSIPTIGTIIDGKGNLSNVTNASIANVVNGSNVTASNFTACNMYTSNVTASNATILKGSFSNGTFSNGNFQGTFAGINATNITTGTLNVAQGGTGVTAASTGTGGVVLNNAPTFTGTTTFNNTNYQSNALEVDGYMGIYDSGSRGGSYPNCYGGIMSSYNGALIHLGVNSTGFGTSNIYGGLLNPTFQGGMIRFDSRPSLPVCQLFVNPPGSSPSTSACAFSVMSNTYIGINTMTPQYQLDVNGSGNFTGALTARTSFQVSTTNGTTYASIRTLTFILSTQSSTCSFGVTYATAAKLYVTFNFGPINGIGNTDSYSDMYVGRIRSVTTTNFNINIARIDNGYNGTFGNNPSILVTVFEST